MPKAKSQRKIPTRIRIYDSRLDVTKTVPPQREAAVGSQKGKMSIITPQCQGFEKNGVSQALLGALGFV